MINPEISHSENRLISDETFTMLRDAATNLFRFGSFADRKRPFFGDLIVEEGMMVDFEPNADLSDRPSHIYSGKIYPTASLVLSFEVWKMFEGSAKNPVTLYENSVIPATIVREEHVCLRHYNSIRKDYIIGMDGDAYLLESAPAPDLMYMETASLLNEETAAEKVYLLEQAGKEALRIYDQI